MLRYCRPATQMRAIRNNRLADFCINIRFALPSGRQNLNESNKESPLSKIARRQFIQLSAVAAASFLVKPGEEARAADLPHLAEDDPTAQSLKYVHASATDGQTCANCALVQGADGDEWRPCQIFPGKQVNAAGWCSVWAPKA